MKAHLTRFCTSQGNPQRGFTLVELWVVITIIIVLAAMVFAVNLKLRPAWNQASLRVSSFEDPSSVLSITFGGYFLNESIGSIYTPVSLPSDRRRAICFLPNRKAIMGFLDGHIAMISPPLPDRHFR